MQFYMATMMGRVMGVSGAEVNRALEDMGYLKRVPRERSRGKSQRFSWEVAEAGADHARVSEPRVDANGETYHAIGWDGDTFNILKERFARRTVSREEFDALVERVAALEGA